MEEAIVSANVLDSKVAHDQYNFVDIHLEQLKEMVLSLHKKRNIQIKQNQEILVKTNTLLEISQKQSQQLEMLSQILHKESNDKVLPAKKRPKHNAGLF